MKGPKLIQILMSFDSEDWRECSDFVHGRMRKGHDCLVLYDHLRNEAFRRKNVLEQLSVIKNSLFPKITKKSFTNILSRLAIAVEEYLVLRAVQKSPNDYRLLLLKEYADRGLFNLFDRKSKELEKELTRNTEIDLFDHLTYLKLNHTKFFSDHPVKVNKGEELLTTLVESNNSFHDQYQLFLKAIQKHFTEISTQRKGCRSPREIPSELDQVLVKLLALKEKREHKDFEDLYSILINRLYPLSVELRTVIIDFLIHFGHFEIKKGNMSGIKELLDLYEYGFDEGLLLSNKKITENRFINVISTACGCGAFERAERIIHHYNHFLLEKTRNGVIQISRAHINFYKGNFEEVIDQIKDYPLNSHSQLTRRRWLLLCSYYQTMNGQEDFLKGQIKNYKSYFYTNKDKLSVSVYNGSLNLGRAILKMVNGRTKQELTSFVNQCEHLIYRTWLRKEIGAYSIPDS